MHRDWEGRLSLISVSQFLCSLVTSGARAPPPSHGQLEAESLAASQETKETVGPPFRPPPGTGICTSGEPSMEEVEEGKFRIEAILTREWGLMSVCLLQAVIPGDRIYPGV